MTVTNYVVLCCVVLIALTFSLERQAWGAGHAAKALEVLLRAAGEDEGVADSVATAIAAIDASGE